MENTLVNKGWLKKNSEGKFILNLNPKLEICKKLFEECPDLYLAEEKLESLIVGLQSAYYASYHKFLNNISDQITLNQLSIWSVVDKRIIIHEKYIKTLCYLWTSTVSVINLTDIKLASSDLKQILESGRCVKTIEMMNCEIPELTSDFKLDDQLNYGIQKLFLRKAFSPKALSIFSKEVMRNTKFQKNLTDIIVTKELEPIVSKCFESTKIKIQIDKFNK